MWFSEHMPQVLVAAGLGLLAIEVLILGFATFFLLFIGLAMIITSALVYLSVIPESWLMVSLCVAIFTGVFALVLWKPLQKMQGHVDKKPVTSDLVGHTWHLAADIAPDVPGQYQYSGITWKVVSTQAIKAGTKVQVIEANVGEFIVKPV